VSEMGPTRHANKCREMTFSCLTRLKYCRKSWRWSFPGCWSWKF